MTDYTHERKRMNSWWTAGVLITLVVIGLVYFSYQFFDHPIHAIPHAEKPVHAAALSEDGRLTLLASSLHHLRFWDNQRNQLLAEVEADPSARIFSLALSPDGEFAATAGVHTISLWNLKQRQRQQHWTMDDTIESIALSPKADFALIALRNNEVHYLNLANGETLYLFSHHQPVNHVAISADGQYALTGGEDNMAKLWDLNSGQLLHSWPHEEAVDRVLFSADSQYAVTATANKGIRLWRVDSGKISKVLQPPPLDITSIAISADNTTLAIGSKPQVVQLWDIIHQKLLAEWTFPKKHFWKPTMVVIHAVAFTQDGQHLRTEDSQGLSRLWAVPQKN